MARAFVLHIGDPKTGSSAIQQVLYQRRWTCAEVSLDYPATLNAVKLANTLRTESLADTVDTRFRRTGAWASASPADVAVISAEQFASIHPNLVHRTFRNAMKDLAPTMRVVAYARPHVSRFISAYSQRVKVGGLSTDIETFFDQMTHGKTLTFHHRFGRWRKVFGDRFILRPMVRSDLQGGDVVKDFLNIALSGASFDLVGKTEANTSMTIEALAGLRLLQSVLKDNGTPPGCRHGVGSQVNRVIGAQGPGQGTKIRLSKQLYAKLNALCREDAEQMDHDFFGRPVMTQALDQAATDTDETTGDADPARYFPTQTFAAITRNGTRLAACFDQFPHVWSKALDRANGNAKKLPPDQTLSGEQLSHIAQVDAILADTIALISG